MASREEDAPVQTVEGWHAAREVDLSVEHSQLMCSTMEGKITAGGKRKKWPLELEDVL